MELLPTPPVPKMKMRAAVSYQVRDIKIPTSETNCIAMDARKISLLPYISARRGVMKADRAQPTNCREPRRATGPRGPYFSHGRLRSSIQL